MDNRKKFIDELVWFAETCNRIPNKNSKTKLWISRFVECRLSFMRQTYISGMYFMDDLTKILKEMKASQIILDFKLEYNSVIILKIETFFSIDVLKIKDSTYLPDGVSSHEYWEILLEDRIEEKVND